MSLTQSRSELGNLMIHIRLHRRGGISLRSAGFRTLHRSLSPRASINFIPNTLLQALTPTPLRENPVFLTCLNNEGNARKRFHGLFACAASGCGDAYLQATSGEGPQTRMRIFSASRVLLLNGNQIL
jgi:hypothetical protein